MDTQKWSLLLKVLDSGSISAAAAQSNYTISGISRMIANLEQEVGFPLLVRNNRGVGPTDECELLLMIFAPYCMTKNRSHSGLLISMGSKLVR